MLWLIVQTSVTCVCCSQVSPQVFQLFRPVHWLSHCPATGAGTFDRDVPGGAWRFMKPSCRFKDKLIRVFSVSALFWNPVWTQLCFLSCRSGRSGWTQFIESMINAVSSSCSRADNNLQEDQGSYCERSAGRKHQRHLTQQTNILMIYRHLNSSRRWSQIRLVRFLCF